MGVLSMTRAIGNPWLRKYGVIPDPDVVVMDRSPSDNFIVIASDGLWNAVTSEEAVHIARRCLDRATGKGVGRASACRIAAKVLMRAATERGSRDNITVIVVDLQEQRGMADAASGKAHAPDSAIPAAASDGSSDEIEPSPISLLPTLETGSPGLRASYLVASDRQLAATLPTRLEPPQTYLLQRVLQPSLSANSLVRRSSPKVAVNCCSGGGPSLSVARLAAVGSMQPDPVVLLEDEGQLVERTCSGKGLATIVSTFSGATMA